MSQISMAEAEELARNLIPSAEFSVSIAANVATSFAFTLAPYIRQHSLKLMGLRRELRFAAGTSTIQQPVLEQVFLNGGRINDLDWEVRMVTPLPRGENYLLVDDKVAVVSRPGGRHGQGLFFLVDDRASVLKIRERFTAVWRDGVDVRLLYSDPLSEISTKRNELVEVSRFQWDRIISELSKRPDLLHSVEPFRFEELVAELLDRDGLEVQLTPRSSDGGKDILAWMDTPVGRHLYFVECKRYSPAKPVGVQLVRQLWGVVDAADATAGLLVTTSQFTRSAIAFTNSVPNRLSLKDYDAMIAWLNKHGG
jgi:hypothetical protein